MNIIAELDKWYKEWRGHSHVYDVNQQLFDSADMQDFARYCIETVLKCKSSTNQEKRKQELLEE